MSNLVSIIIPCYNGSAFILQTIQSIFNQSHTNIEIIFVNDGSTDNSLALVQQLNDKRIVIIDKSNSGVSDSRNIGFSMAKGEYILFLDADDLLSEKFIEKGISAIKQNKVDFCTSYIQKIDLNNNNIKNINTHGAHQNIQLEIATFNQKISACPSCYLYKQDSLIQNNIHFATNLKSPEDRHFLFQVGKYLNGTILEKNEGLMYYRVNQNSLSHNISKNLLLMQESFYLQTIQDNLLTGEVKRIFTHKMAYQLLSTFIKLKDFKKAIKYLILYIKTF